MCVLSARCHFKCLNDGVHEYSTGASHTQLGAGHTCTRCPLSRLSAQPGLSAATSTSACSPGDTQAGRHTYIHTYTQQKHETSQLSKCSMCVCAQACCAWLLGLVVQTEPQSRCTAAAAAAAAVIASPPLLPLLPLLLFLPRSAVGCTASYAPHLPDAERHLPVAGLIDILPPVPAERLGPDLQVRHPPIPRHAAGGLPFAHLLHSTHGENGNRGFSG